MAFRRLVNVVLKKTIPILVNQSFPLSSQEYFLENDFSKFLVLLLLHDVVVNFRPLFRRHGRAKKRCENSMGNTGSFEIYLRSHDEKIYAQHRKQRVGSSHYYLYGYRKFQ